MMQGLAIGAIVGILIFFTIILPVTRATSGLGAPRDIHSLVEQLSAETERLRLLTEELRAASEKIRE